MKLGEFKRNIINLGFEEEDVFDETENLFVDALNRARMMIYASVEMGIGTDIPKKIVYDATDDTELDIEEEKTPLLQLLTAYFVWLDDDERKAVMYYNLYNEQLSMYLNRNNRAEVIGGIDI